jgi:prepilin-type N-terminal cleavage/methylation domain-containing protein/prepilin-type processing-associated H-X9-DG protein
VIDMVKGNFMRSRSSAAFTLIELLVVMCIIAILGSILFPAVSRVVQTSRQLICASNERLLVAACFAYTTDNSGSLPIPSLGWEPPGSNGENVAWAMDNWGIADFNVGTLWPYVSSSPEARAKVMFCPSDDNECYPTVGGTAIIVTRNFSYSLNGNIRFFEGNSTSMPLRAVRSPAKHVLLFEEFGPNDGINYGPGDADDYLSGRHGAGAVTNYIKSPAYWTTDGMANVGYFDGHVELMAVKYFFAGNEFFYGPLTQ